ncbi:MAG: endonuclease [Ruminococcaceae bacterium]|nr:endonuclease [Oscillospiraceae bacterium]
MLKKILIGILVVLLLIVLNVGIFVGWLSYKEYKPEPVSPATTSALGEYKELNPEHIKLVSWNIGYGGLGKEASFVLDGGKGAGKPETKDISLGYLEGVRKTMADYKADIYMLQEVDKNSSRSYRTDQIEALQNGLNSASAAFALNYSCPFVPFPIPPIGEVNAGQLTLSDFKLNAATRISLPVPFKWPMRVANLKRCLLETRFPIPGKDAELVVLNLHLEAYDSGEGKIAQTKMLMEILTDELKKGNYVIAGGDFNQTFPGATKTFPIIDPTLWVPGFLQESDLPEGFRFVFDDKNPSCRLLNAPYDVAKKDSTQFYIIDGFIVSSNIEVLSVKTDNLEFVHSDHNPVLLEIKLK